MSNINSINDAVNDFKLGMVKEELNETAKKHKVELKAGPAAEVKREPEVRKIIIPEGMDLLQGAADLITRYTEEETYQNYSRAYPNLFLNDYLIAIDEMVKKYFGAKIISNINTSGRPSAPNNIQFSVGIDDYGRVINREGFTGSLKPQCWPGSIADVGINHLIIRAKKKYEKQVNQFLQEVQDYTVKNSVIRGQAVRIEMHPVGVLNAIPIFTKTNNKVVLNDKTHRIVHNLIIPALGETQKKALLFTGDFGTFKHLFFNVK